MRKSLKLATMTAGAGALVLTAAACGSSTSTDASAPASPSADATTASAPFGPACSAVPKSGPGSVDVIANQPVATAASDIPALSTLVAQVKAAGLVETLNTTKGITVFAPTNDAFAAVPAAALKSLTDDPKGALANVLKYHVVAGELTPAQLPGKHTTLEGKEITVTGSGESFTINDSAKIVCGNVKTANATVYVIDGVLLPPTS
jgi:uncharacterized surface protein with fasciclin (FAS1) repeats